MALPGSSGLPKQNDAYRGCHKHDKEAKLMTWTLHILILLNIRDVPKTWSQFL